MLSLRWILLCLFAWSLTSCSGSQPGSSAKIQLQMPKNISKQNQSLASSQVGCFAVSIQGEGITPIKPSSCDAEYGIFAGLVAAGGSVELSATYGQQRTIDIYYVVSDQGCRTLESGEGLGQLFGSNNVHRISRLSNINFDKPEVKLEAVIEWPTRANSLAQILSAAASCIKGDDPLDPMKVTQATAVLGSAYGTTTDGSLMQVKVKDHRIPTTQPKNWSGKISPVRLGEE